MKTKLIFALAVLSAVGLNASANEYQLAEVTYQPPKIAVYNDGKNTYIQSIRGLVIKGATADGDRLIISGVPREIEGWMNGKPITINQYASSQNVPAYPRQAAPSYPSATAPAPTQASEVLAARLAKLEQDLKRKEQAYQDKNAPKAAQVVAQSTPVKAPEPAKVEAVKPVVPEQVWEIRKSDGTLFNALTRWVNSAIPKHQLVYDTDGKDFASDPEASFTGNFDSAIGQLMESMQYSAYPLRACMWDNKPYPVLKIVHKNKRCED